MLATELNFIYHDKQESPIYTFGDENRWHPKFAWNMVLLKCASRMFDSLNFLHNATTYISQISNLVAMVTRMSGRKSASIQPHVLLLNTACKSGFATTTVSTYGSYFWDFIKILLLFEMFQTIFTDAISKDGECFALLLTYT